MSRRRVAVIAAVTGAILLMALLFGRRGADAVAVELGRAESRDVFRSYVSASGELLAERYADVGSSVMGRIVELPVAEGQSVSSGDLLARVDPVQARSELEAAEAAIRALEADARSARELVDSARADLELAEALAREAVANRQRLQALFDQELIAASELDAARASAESRTAQVAASRAAVNRAESGAEAAQRRVGQARAKAERARELEKKTAIVAPISGVVSALPVREGEMVVIGIQNQPGTVLMTVSDLAELNAEVLVAEADVLRVEVGQEATVTLEALPERRFRGRVTEVGASALPQTGGGVAAREFRVEIRLEEPEPGLRPGLTCDAEILVGEERDVVVVPLQAVVLRGGSEGGPGGTGGSGGNEERGVFVVEDGIAQFTPVETGIIGGLDIEVRGIEVGTEIVIGPYQVLRDLEDGAAVAAR